ncbi:hypothetical protein [Chitinasiproducens palmae]|uniref:Uncharacterized protein n=1 Tax=Chitinasiproducens palmae TaxID=1770053 RepID=A0A1H2PRJ6_9BURK|nr:hypothetical protein [Chitinasiproducens palmae]SDV49067.1 hypothetical protein SAMN05216551_10737 [Chitinasiproducens palmae]
MTIQITSNASYEDGKYSLTNIADIDPNYYKKRVLADGGMIVDQAALDAALSWLHALKLSIFDCWAVSAAWGVKKNDDGTLVKVYSLDGNDFIPKVTTGNLPVLDTSGDFPVLRRRAAAAGTTASGLLVSQTLASLVSDNDFTFAAMQATEAGDNFPMGCGPALVAGSSTVITGVPLSLAVYNNDVAHTYAAAGINNAAGTGAVQLNNAKYADYMPQVTHVNYKTSTMKYWAGTDGPYATSNGAAGLYDFRKKRFNMFCLAYNNGTADYALATKGACREQWLIRRSSESIALALLSRMRSL